MSCNVITAKSLLSEVANEYLFYLVIGCSRHKNKQPIINFLKPVVTFCFNTTILSFKKKTRTKFSQQYRETQDQLDYVEKQLEMLTNETKDSITQMAEQVEKKVMIG